MYISCNSSKNHIQGIVWIIIKGFVFSIISVMISKISHQIHVFEIFFITMLVRLIFLLPWAGYTKQINLKINYPHFYIIRSILTTLSLVLWFYALKITPVIEATAISYITPLFSVIIASLFLQEKLSSKRAVAIVIGFIGAIIALQPNPDLLKTKYLEGGILTLFTAFIWALTDIISKIQADKEHIGAQTFYNTLFMVLFSLPLALMVWQNPNLKQLLWLTGIGILFLINHLTLTLAYNKSHIVVLAPFAFTRICITIILAYFFLDDTPSIWSIVGAHIILASSLYILYIEKYSTLYNNNIYMIKENK